VACTPRWTLPSGRQAWIPRPPGQRRVEAPGVDHHDAAAELADLSEHGLVAAQSSVAQLADVVASPAPGGLRVDDGRALVATLRVRRGWCAQSGQPGHGRGATSGQGAQPPAGWPHGMPPGPARVRARRVSAASSLLKRSCSCRCGRWPTPSYHEASAAGCLRCGPWRLRMLVRVPGTEPRCITCRWPGPRVPAAPTALHGVSIGNRGRYPSWSRRRVR
jgi:hypothetical protein